MIKTSTGEVCSPNEDIKALDLHGTNALRAKLLQIQADSGSGEVALLAETQIAVGVEQAEQAEIDKAQQALLDFRSYLAQSPGQAAHALPSDSELAYNYNPDTQQCEITRTDDEDMVLDIANSGLNGELPLPPQLMVTRLDCYNNKLTALPELPTSLTELWCYSNKLTTLPEVLPASLTVLWCSNNKLTTLPEVLPASLTLLHCSKNQLTSLPELPASLTELGCNSNQLTSLSEVLPASLTRLHCANNQLTTLPEVLPTSLTELNCRSNQLTKLPEVLPPSLADLNCSSNQLITLPELPASLTLLGCSGNRLTTLPELPTSLTELHCSNNLELLNNPAAQAALRAMRDRGGNVSS